MTKLMMQWQGGALHPATPADERACERFRSGHWYKVNATNSRNPGHHRKAFALINLIFDSQERFATLEDLLVDLKIRAGWYTEHIRTPPDHNALKYIERVADRIGGRVGGKLAKAARLLREQAAIVYVPKSISFDAMDQTEFEQFYERLIDIARDDFGLQDTLAREGFFDTFEVTL